MRNPLKMKIKTKVSYLDKFEAQQNLGYVYNMLRNVDYVSENLNDIKDWAVKKGLLAEEEIEGLAATDPIKAAQKIKRAALKLKQHPIMTGNFAVSCLENNLNLLQQLFGLTNDERKFFGFVIREKCDEYLSRIINVTRRNARDLSALDRAVFTGIKPNKIYDMCRHGSRLYQLGFIEGEYDGNIDVTRLARNYYYQRFESLEQLRVFLVGNPQTANLAWSDFKHIEQAAVIKKLLDAALKRKMKGINILLYGEPGTGKTEFAKTLAATLSTQLYALGEDENAMIADYGDSRYRQLQRAQIILRAQKNVCLMMDEAEDVLGSCHSFYGNRKEEEITKLQVNRLLENNPQPIIWISNHIRYMDKAYLRRFTYALHFETPKPAIRAQMWRKNLCNNHFDADTETVNKFAKKYSLSPAFIASAVRSTNLIGGNIKDIEQTLDVLQQAYNNGYKVKEEKVELTTEFNPKLLNTDVDLNKLAERIFGLSKMNFSMCLYGASGTGKSAYAQYLAEKLNLPVIKKRCSDLLSKYVGETEENIAAAFAEAKEREGLLIFDEADSFLQERSGAFRNWEVTQVNEMLTQMEQHKYPFICTTNLMDRLDKASLRRFTFKVRYDYLTDEQRSLCFEHFFSIKNADLRHLPQLTPGDFVVVRDKAEILDCLENKAELIKMLEQEQQNKLPVSRPIGFI
ncbi:MAG: AAA family ATPase [Alphaproteobacteria bacterium]|nr:AAA family ATPase [Alphaproteobacteria bacterium]